MVIPLALVESKWRQPKMHLNQRKNSSVYQP